MGAVVSRVNKWVKSLFALDVIIALALYGFLGTLVTYLIVTRELDLAASARQRYSVGLEGLRWDLDFNSLVMARTALCVGLCVLVCALLSRWQWRHRASVRWIVSSALVLGVLFSGVVYLYMARGVAQRTFVKAHDSYHYYLGPKYYAELGYWGLYEATIVADGEDAVSVLRGTDRVRDLSTYGFITVAEARGRGDIWKERFSEQRWREFRDDIAVYKQMAGAGMRDILRDHGYNGTPFHAWAAGKVAHLFPLTYRNAVLASLYDIFGLLFMMILVSWAFGWKGGALFAIFFFTSFTDRHYYIGGSFLRYYWMILTGVGIAFLRRRFYVVSGFMLSTAAMFNVFPLLFMLGIGVKAAHQTLARQRVPRRYCRFIAGAASATVLLGLLSVLHAEGVGNYRSFFANMANHTDLVTRSRIGLRYLFLLPNEFLNAPVNYGYAEKARDLALLKPWYQLTGALLTAFALYQSRKRSDTEAALLGGMSAFVFWFNTVEYYYGMIGMLPLIWLRDKRTRYLRSNAFLFLGMALIYEVYLRTGSLMVCHNYLVTTMLTLALLTTNVGILYEGIPISWRNRLFAPQMRIVVMSYLRRFTCLLSPGRMGMRHWASVAVIACVIALGFSSWCYFDRHQKEHIDAAYDHGVLVFGGDVSLARRQHIITFERGVADALGNIHLLKNADLSVVNLECVVAQGGILGIDKNEPGPYYYRARPEMLGILEAAGIDVVITANNHSGDYGVDALLEQIEHLDAMNMGHTGAGANIEQACTPVVRRVGDVSVAIFGIDTYQRSFAAGTDRPGNCYLDLNAPEEVHQLLTPRIAAARERADLVFVAIHWGANLKETPDAQKRRFGYALIDAGADAILGSSAHIFQGVEIYEGKPIIHDAGNLLFDYVAGDSGLFSLTLTPDGVREVRFLPLSMRPGYTRLASSRQARAISSRFIELSEALGTKFQMNSDGSASLHLMPEPGKERPLRWQEAPLPNVGSAPQPMDEPPPGCAIHIDDIPKGHRRAPITVGPLELVGVAVAPEGITRREMLYVTTYWRIPKNTAQLPAGLLLDIRAESNSNGARWSGAHEPCDWGWPTQHFRPDMIYRDHYGLRPPAIRDISDGQLTITAAVLTSSRKPLGERVTLGSIPVRVGN